MALTEATKNKIAAIKTQADIATISFNEELGNEGAELLAEAIKDKPVTKITLKNSHFMAGEGIDKLINELNNLAGLSSLYISEDPSLARLFTAAPNFSALNDKARLALIVGLHERCNELNKENNQLSGKVLSHENTLSKHQSLVSKLDSRIIILETQNANKTTLIEQLQKQDNEKEAIIQLERNNIAELKNDIARLEEMINKMGKKLDETIVIQAERVSASEQVSVLMAEERDNQIRALTGQLNKHKRAEQTKLAAIEKQSAETISNLEECLKLQASAMENLKCSLETEIAHNQSDINRIKSGIDMSQPVVNELLFRAARTGNFTQAKVALEVGAQLDALDPATGETAFITASQQINAGESTDQRTARQIAELMIERNASVVNYPDQNSDLPLKIAVQMDDYAPWTKYLLTKLHPESNNAVDIDVKKEIQPFYELASPANKEVLALYELWLAVKTNNLGLLQHVCENTALNLDINHLTHETGKDTLLYQAVSLGYEEIVRYLLAKGADINLKSFVISPKADATPEEIDIQIKKQESAFELACRPPYTKLAKLLVAQKIVEIIQNHESKTRVNELLATAESITKSAREIFTEKVILDENNFCNQSILHIAAQSPHAEYMAAMLEKLLDGDALLETTDINGKTPLHVAVEQQQPDIVAMLLEKGCRIDSKDTSGQVPLHKAVTNFQADTPSSMMIIENLVKHHADCRTDIYIEDSAGIAPLQIACNNKDFLLASQLGKLYGGFEMQSSLIGSTESRAALNDDEIISHVIPTTVHGKASNSGLWSPSNSRRIVLDNREEKCQLNSSRPKETCEDFPGSRSTGNFK